MTLPLTQAAPSEHSATRAPATSAGVVRRPAGCIERTRSIICSLPGILRSAGVSVTPARRALTEMRCGASLRRVLPAGARDRRHDLAPPRVVGRVDVEELGLPAGCSDLRDDPVGVRLSGLPVEVDAEDVPTGFRERDRARLAETGRGAEHEGPPRTGFRGQNGADVSTRKAIRRATDRLRSRAVNSEHGGA